MEISHSCDWTRTSFLPPFQFIMTIHHIILYKFKPEATPEQRQSVKDAANALASQIPEIQSLVTGETVFNPRGHGYDAGVIFLFESTVTLSEYRVHKAHVDYQAFSAPYLEDKLIFDIETA
ncbi:stress responsive A/B barrel domain-containing protein [Suillus bovinus]|uniref:stress responsive A/B barrel domain-containing protein n=1 Tax=Suillus bovinus TaxID=48563 RepID=UPI001B8664FB|nr:stress responsive A/B barrel domain-containing protein [Suillus bovinus]KAG2155885.1 stress responsive A/B barrel domain-containing protein [Suillus bovinus]